MSVPPISSIPQTYTGDVFATQEINDMQAALEKTDSLVERIKNSQTQGSDAELLDACREFESYFLQIMMKEMRRTVPESTEGLFVKSNAEKIFTDMLDEQTSILAANSGGIGLAGFLYKQMKREGQ